MPVLLALFQGGAAVLMTEFGAAELRDLVASELGRPHAPRDVEFVAGLPMTHEDKVDKKALRARYHHA